MTEMSPLLRRMIEDMTIRNLSPATQRSYIHAVVKFSRYFKRSQDTISIEEVGTYQVHLVGLPSYSCRKINCVHPLRPYESRQQRHLPLKSALT